MSFAERCDSTEIVDPMLLNGQMSPDLILMLLLFNVNSDVDDGDNFDISKNLTYMKWPVPVSTQSHRNNTCEFTVTSDAFLSSYLLN
jgi:hypothetical protein